MLQNIITSIKETLRLEFPSQEYRIYYDPARVDSTRDGFLINKVNYTETMGVGDLLTIQGLYDITFIQKIEKTRPLEGAVEDRFYKSDGVVSQLFALFTRMDILGFENEERLTIRPERWTTRVENLDHFFLSIEFLAYRKERYEEETGESIQTYTIIKEEKRCLWAVERFQRMKKK